MDDKPGAKRRMRAIHAVVGRLPYPLGEWLAKTAGSLIYWLIPKIRHMTTANVATAFPKKPAAWHRSVARRSCGHRSLIIYELMRFGRKPYDILDRIDVEGREHLDAALAEDRGVLMMSGHEGNYWLQFLFHRWALDRETYLLSLMEHQLEGWRISTTRDYINRVILPAGGITLVDILDRPKPAMSSALANGETVFALPDIPYAGRTVPGRFLGLDHPVPLGLGKLAAENDAIVLPVATMRGARGRHTIRFHEPLPAAELGDEQTLRTFLELYQQRVREAPEQWMWFFPPAPAASS